MVFFDTCIWIELCCLTTPSNAAEQQQAAKASQLLTKTSQSNKCIVTCREQLLEIISAVEKRKMRQYNKACRQASVKQVGQLKDYRSTTDFPSAQVLCRQTIEDVCHLATEKDLGAYSIDDLLNNIHLVDINDYLYYQYCISNNVDFYSFDSDFLNLNASPLIHII